MESSSLKVFRNQKFNNPQLLCTYVHIYFASNWWIPLTLSTAFLWKIYKLHVHNTSNINWMWLYVHTCSTSSSLLRRQVAVTNTSWILHVRLHMNTTMSAIYVQLTITLAVTSNTRLSYKSHVTIIPDK